MVASLSPMIAGGSEALAEDAARHDSDLHAVPGPTHGKGCVIRGGRRWTRPRLYQRKYTDRQAPWPWGSEVLGEIAFFLCKSACTSSKTIITKRSSNADRSANLDHLAGAARVGSLTTWRLALMRKPHCLSLTKG